MSDPAAKPLDDDLEPDPVIEACKAGIDRTLGLAEEARRAGAR